MGRYSKLDIRTKLQAILAGGGRDRAPARTTRSVRRLRRLTGPEVDDLVDRYQSGESIRALADAFRMHRTTISAQLKARGAMVHARQLSAPETAEVIRRYEQGWSLVRVAEDFGISDTRVARLLHQAGVPTRPVGTNQWSDHS